MVLFVKGSGFPVFRKMGYAKEMPILRDLNSRSRRMGISFARQNNLPEKKPAAY
jgi:hypothetical protein